MYPTTGSPSATQDPKSIPQLVSKADVPRYPNSHSVDKGNEEIEPNQQEEKVPLNTSESSLTSQASKSIPKIPRKEAVVENQKKIRHLQEPQPAALHKLPIVFLG